MTWAGEHRVRYKLFSGGGWGHDALTPATLDTFGIEWHVDTALALVLWEYTP